MKTVETFIRSILGSLINHMWGSAYRYSIKLKQKK